MQIKSSFKDYMDGMQRYGIDKDTVWLRYPQVREVSELDIGLLPKSDYFHVWDGKKHEYLESYLLDEVESLVPMALGFCGKIYHFYLAKLNDQKTKGVYSLEDLKKICKRELPDCFYESRFYYGGVYPTFYEFFELKTTPYEDPRLFAYLKVATFLYYEGKKWDGSHYKCFNSHVTNPRLSDLGFASVKDPFAAYQEVNMFLNGPLVQREDPLQITDSIVLRDAKGFDDKSFKQISPGKKARRRAKG